MMSIAIGCLKLTRRGRGVIARAAGGESRVAVRALMRTGDVTGSAAAALLIATGRVAFVTVPGVRADGVSCDAGSGRSLPGSPRPLAVGGGRTEGPAGTRSDRRLPRSPRPLAGGGGRGEGSAGTHSDWCLGGGTLMGVTRSPAHKVVSPLSLLLIHISLLLP